MNDKKLRERKNRIAKIVKHLKKLFPNAGMVLVYKTNWELLVAVVLSAQCTDKRVNEVTQKLFKKYKTFNDYIRVSVQEFEQDIRSTGFYRNKAKNILAAAKIIKKEFGGTIPKTMEEILTIPGVARKTANVVLGNAYGIVKGIAVDTHVRRFVIKFDLSDYKDPVKIEQDLMELLPKKEWFDFTYRLIEYGRNICKANKHECKEHPISKIYPPAASNWPKAK